VALATTQGPLLGRHETDELYGVMLAAGLDAGVAVLTGPQPPNAVGSEIYRRLATDLRANGATVLADLSDGALHGALLAGIDLLKVSEDELIAEGSARAQDRTVALDAARELQRQGARGVVVSRAAEPALALLGDRLYELAGPRLEPSDPQGAGDSMFAGIAVGVASHWAQIDAVRFGMAAGALNVTRRGLGTGHRAEVERLVAHVRVRDLGEIGNE
jgi:1-phosphofructokinase